MTVKIFIRKLTFSNNQWEINIGSMAGYEQGNRVFVYPIDEKINNLSIPLEILTIESCKIRKSIVSSSDALDKEKNYQALVYNTSFPLAVAFKGDSGAVELLQSSLYVPIVANELYYTDLIYETLNSQYFVLAKNNSYMVYNVEEEGKVLFSSKGFSENSALEIMKKLTLYLYWEQVFHTNNENKLNKIVDFNILYKGRSYNKDFLIIDDEFDRDNIFSYVATLDSGTKEMLNLSLLIFDEEGKTLYDGFSTEFESFFTKGKSLKGKALLSFSSEDIKNEIYEKNYFFKLYSSTDFSWASKMIKLSMLYATPIEILKDEIVEVYKGIKVKSHDALVITFLATKELIISKDFNQKPSFKPSPNRDLLEASVQGIDMSSSISTEKPLIFMMEGEHQVDVYSSQGNTYHEVDMTTNYENGVTEIQITSVVEEEDNSWINLSFLFNW